MPGKRGGGDYAFLTKINILLSGSKQMMENLAYMVSALENSITIGNCFKLGSSMSCLVSENLDVIHLNVFKFSEDPPISRYSKYGLQ